LVIGAKQSWKTNHWKGQSQSKKIYVYNQNQQKLLITAPSMASLIKGFNFDKSTLVKYLKSGECYLKSFVFRRHAERSAFLTQRVKKFT
jgi:hypothetical protein